MALFTPGYTFQQNELGIIPAKFHQFVDSAYLIKVVNADMASGSKLPYIATPASPATGDVRVGSDGLLEMFFSAAWTDQPTDLQTLTLTNKSGSNLTTGAVVVADPANANSFTISAVDRAPNVIGVLAEDINNNNSGLVYIRGKCTVRITTSGFGQAPGDVLRGPNGTTGTTNDKTSAVIFGSSASARSDSFGVLLDFLSAGGTQLKSCYIWK